MNPDLNSSLALDFLTTLKSETAVSHKKLESLPISSCIVSPDMKMNDYAHYLRLMYDVHYDVEEKIFPLLADLKIDLKERTKKHLIEQDLNFLRFKTNSPTPVFHTENISIPFALGILYVVEGSTLGGRFILKNLETIDGLDQGNGVAYFTGYGNKTGSQWKLFLNFLTDYEEQFNCKAAIIEGATYAFDCIYNHFLLIKNEN